MYQGMSRIYTVITLALLVFHGVASVAFVAMLCGGLLSNIFSGFSISILAVIVQLLVCALLVFGGYTALDKVTKAVMFVLTSATLPFLISLMGWVH